MSGTRLSRSQTVAGSALALGLTGAAFLLATPATVAKHMGVAFDLLGGARPIWLWLAGLAFLASLVGSAGAWMAALGACGTRLPVRDCLARHAVGSVVNTFVPFQAGEVVRVGLFARVVDRADGVWTVGGALAAIGIARAACLAVLVAAAWATGGLPLWPLLALGGLVLVGLAIAVRARTTVPRSRMAHALDAFRALGGSPRDAAALLGWVALSAGSRVAAAAAVGEALGVRSPFVAALLIVAAIDVAGQLPLTPGNIGVANGAVSIALASRGIPLGTSLAVGIAFQMVQTLVDLAVGVAGSIYLAPVSSPLAGRRFGQLAAATGLVALAAGFSLTVVVNLA